MTVVGIFYDLGENITEVRGDFEGNEGDVFIYNMEDIIIYTD